MLENSLTCDITDGVGWTIIHRRADEDVEFNVTYSTYVEGFGEVGGNFWIGLENMHQLTQQGNSHLRIYMEQFTGITVNHLLVQTYIYWEILKQIADVNFIL